MSPQRLATERIESRIRPLRERLTPRTAAQVEVEARRLPAELASHEEGLCLLAMTLLLQNRPGEAEPLLRQALSRNPNHARSLVNLGGLELKRGDAQAASATLTRAVRQVPEGSASSLAALTNLALALLTLGREMDAAKVVLRIYRARRDHLEPAKLVQAATTLEAMGNDGEAIEILLGVYRSVGNISLTRHLAELLERRGDFQRAAVVFRDLFAAEAKAGAGSGGR
ncbi:tetratricopeptide repeat protein [Synechococcus sp. RSCCF101]|nr:tetratricopeptide repeat protein [Synechococcus sp. RSCCF101]